jgi:hypothetical protein
MTPSDEAIDQLLERLDRIAVNAGHNGLPSPHNKRQGPVMREAVRLWLSEHSPEASQA